MSDSISRTGAGHPLALGIVATIAAFVLAACGGGSSSSPSAQPATTASADTIAQVNSVATTYFTNWYNRNYPAAQAVATGTALLRMQFFTELSSIPGISPEALPPAQDSVSVTAKIASGTQTGDTLTTSGPVTVSRTQSGQEFTETRADLAFAQINGTWLISDWRTVGADGQLNPPSSAFWFPGNSSQSVGGITASALVGAAWPDQNKGIEFIDWVIRVENQSPSEVKLAGLTWTTDSGVTGKATVGADGKVTMNFPPALGVEIEATIVYPPQGKGSIYVGAPPSSGIRGGKVSLVFSTSAGDVTLVVDLPTVSLAPGYTVVTPSVSAAP